MTKEANLEYKITPFVSRELQEIHLKCEDFAGNVRTEILRTKDEAIRQALIKLGWTPPADDKAKP